MNENVKTNIKFNIIAIICILIFAFAISPKTLQNDTFYTIKIGEHILNSGIDMEDPFSWQDLTYTYPHWAYDVMIYFFYNIGGHLGIYISTIIFTAILGLIIYFTNDEFTNNKPMSFVLTIAVMYLLKDFIAARAQLVTFILFALEVLFIEKLLNTGKKRYIVGLIIIPILIANLHAAVFYFYFILYLPYIAEYIIALLADQYGQQLDKRIKKIKEKLLKCNDENKKVKLNNKLEKLIKIKENKETENEPYKIIINKRKTTKILLIIMIICLFTGLLTPQTSFEPYTHLFKLMKGNSTKNISEHLPLTLAKDLTLAVVFIFFLSIMIFTDTKIRLCDLFMLGGLTALTFMSRRQESMFMIMCIPIFNRMLTSFLNKYDKNGTEQMKKIMVGICGTIVTICLVLIISLLSYNNKYKNNYISKKSYPVEASKWILDNLDINNIKLYNEYNYGSYLLYEGIPVFIDSRCDLYTPEFNEGKDIFNDFLAMANMTTNDLEGMFNKYGFTHFITYKKAKLCIYLNSNPDKYSIIYSDDNFVIYEKVK